MSTLAEIVNQFGSDYLEARGGRLPPSHGRTLHDIVSCRTPSLGGHIYHCADCDETHFQYHSCQNRHCPQCQYQAGQDWLAKQQQMLLPVPYFLVTFTLPQHLRPVALRQPKLIYNLLFRTAAAALQELAWDPRHIGGQLGLIGVLHTWGRQLVYHPHIHFLVPAVALSADGLSWLPIKETFLVPVRALSRLFRGKFRYSYLKAVDGPALPAETWSTEWVVHCQPIGDGLAALNYLAPYIFRVAISNKRILRVTGNRVTFRYRATDSGTLKTCTLAALEFLRRYLQHVLPKGFVKVRYFGFFSPACRPKLTLLRLWLDATGLFEIPTEEADDQPREKTLPTITPRRLPTCPVCRQTMQLVCKLPRQWPTRAWQPP